MLARIVKNYMTPGLILTIAAAVLIVLAGTVILWFRLPKYISGKTSMKVLRLNVLKTACMVLALSFSLNMGMKTQAISQDFKNLADAYDEYGFAYCFSNSVVDKGIAKPELYSEEMMDIIASGMETSVSTACGVSADETVKTTSADTASADSLYPDIIMIQLESFFDVKYIENFTCSKDPVPFFTYLKEHCPSGFLEVPSIGAGTANTEFECITGMNLDFFGPGEYPYKTVLKERTCESMAYILKELGYTTTAMHNNDGTFYGRNVVFSNLGFERYCSVEYMKNAKSINFQKKLLSVLLN
jgi:phosphoglycerol transferase MdoB-like AlkP superfamily enzyme